MEPQQQQDPHQQQQQGAQLQLQPTTLIEDGMSCGSSTTSGSSSSKQSSFLCRQTSTRWTPTTDQIRILKDLYYNNGVRSPSAEQIQRISARLRQYGKIEGKNVFYWFQNHKARERQKKRFTVDMASTMQQQQQQQLLQQRSQSCSDGGGGGNVIPGGYWKQQTEHDYSINLPKYSNISPGISSPSSPSSHGVLSAGQIGSTSYGSVLMEKSFRECSISAGATIPTVVGGPISNNNLGWVGIHHPHPYSSSTSSYHANFLDQNTKPFHQFFKEAAHGQSHPQNIETLPLFPMHNGGVDIPGFYTNGGPNPDHHTSSGYIIPTSSTDGYNCNRPSQLDDKSGATSRTSLELTLNSYTPITPDTD